MAGPTGPMSALIPKLTILLTEEYKLPRSIRQDIEHLLSDMQSMEAFVLMLQRDWLDGPVDIWVKDVTKLACDMEVMVDRIRVLAPNPECFKGFMKNMGNLFKKGKTRNQMIANEIKHIKAQVRYIVERRGRYKIADDFSVTLMTNVDPRLSAEYLKGKSFIGVDGKKYQELMKLLSYGDNVPNKKLKIVSVVGFGGSGKTTIVKALYDEIQEGFNCKAFVIAGRDANAKKVFKDIIFDITMEESYLHREMDEQQLTEKLLEILENKRYLIVIDDIWNADLWIQIKYVFRDLRSLGSRIITTTRIVSVSKACCPSASDSIYQMEPLSDDDSQSLFYGRLFPPGNECPHEFEQEFEQASKDVLKKCGGLPLAILTVASILVDGSRMKWLHMLKCIDRGLLIDHQSWQEMHTILSFSYYDLPPHLKTCLLYCSIFSESHAIERDRLVKKWIAERIITLETKFTGLSNKKELSLEEAASQYLEELVNRNVIQPLECNSHYEVITYHIHPMMHRVLKAIALEKRFAASLHEKDISRSNGDFRHVSIDCPDSENVINLSSMAFEGGVRSLTVFGQANLFMLKHFRAIRVLDLEGCKSIERAHLECICCIVLLKRLCLAKTQITELPPQIGNLQYLEGLDVGGTQITKLPKEIGNLKYLERLDVGGTQITELPTQMGKLENLKTLDARNSRLIPDQVVRLTRLVHLLIGDKESCGVKLPDGVGKLTSLEQLCTIDLRKCSESSLKELGGLPYLREIAVVSSDEPEDARMNNALLSSLSKSTELRSLVVYSDFRLSTLQSTAPYKYLNCRKKLTVARSLEVPIGFSGQPFLSILDIRVCKLEDNDIEILGWLPRLRILILRLEVLPRTMVRISCEGFAELESLCVDCRMPRVIFEEGAMPKLRHLELKLYDGSASEKHMDIKHLPKLQEVRLRYLKWYATNKGVKESIEAVKTEAKEHQNKISFSISEENKDGTCTLKTEVFEENKEAGCSRMTETEEEYGHEGGTDYFLNGNDTQEGDNLHQSNHASAIASSSGTKEIQEVVE